MSFGLAYECPQCGILGVMRLSVFVHDSSVPAFGICPANGCINTLTAEQIAPLFEDQFIKLPADIRDVLMHQSMRAREFRIERMREMYIQQLSHSH